MNTLIAFPLLSTYFKLSNFQSSKVCLVASFRKRGPEVDGRQEAEVGEDANLASNVAAHEPRGAPDLAGKEIQGLQDRKQRPGKHANAHCMAEPNIEHVAGPPGPA